MSNQKQKEYYVEYNDNEGHGKVFYTCDEPAEAEDVAQALELLQGTQGTMIDEFREATVLDKVNIWLEGKLS